jgi:glutamate racemase
MNTQYATRNTPYPVPIGVFDSGVGGLSVTWEIMALHPAQPIIYLADQAHAPYGQRPLAEIRTLAEGVAVFLLAEGAGVIVVACNTASAAALKSLRETFTQLPVIGMEPAVKPAAAMTRSGVVGILATPATFQGRLFQATAGRYASGIELVRQVCDGLAERVERGELDGPETEAELRGFLQPIIAAGADTVVLACTHYPFVIEPIRRIVGPQVSVIDPAPAIARHLGDVLDAQGLAAHRGRTGRHAFFTSGEIDPFRQALTHLTGVHGTVHRRDPAHRLLAR